MLKSVSHTPLRFRKIQQIPCWVHSAHVRAPLLLSVPNLSRHPRGPAAYMCTHTSLACPQVYPHTPALIVHEAHTPMASLTPRPSYCSSVEIQLMDLPHRVFCPPAQGPLTSAPTHSPHTYCVNAGLCMITPVVSSAKSHALPAQSLLGRCGPPASILPRCRFRFPPESSLGPSHPIRATCALTHPCMQNICA